MRPLGFDLADALTSLLEAEGSDLHLKVGNRPLIRANGHLRPLHETSPVLQPHNTEEILHALLPERRIAEFEYNHELDFAHSVPGVARFRVNAYMQRGTISLVMRVVPSAMHSIEELGLPAVVQKLAEEPRGFVLVTGSTGCGKSTTLASMVDHMNRSMAKHIVTIEDPIEFLHRDMRCSVDQREVGSDTMSFAGAVRQALRQDPDVIMVGEMRDEETVRAALSAADTGHLVLSTLHTLDAAETINRIIEFFLPHERQQVRGLLAGTLRGIVSQRLVPAPDGESRVPICEVLTMTGRTHDFILDPKETGNLKDVISEGAYYGMQTFDQALYSALERGDVTMEAALDYASNPHDFKLLVAAEGSLGTTMKDVGHLAP